MGRKRRSPASIEDSPHSSDSTISSAAAPKHSEKRREYWRVAIRDRRAAEGEAFQELRKELPVSPAVRRPLDRMATLRVAISYIKLRSVL